MDPRYRFIQCYSRQGRVAVLVEFDHEKTYTAESSEFTDLSRSIAMHIAVLSPQSTPGLLRQRYDKDPSLTVEAALAAVAAQVGDRPCVEGGTRIPGIGLICGHPGSRCMLQLSGRGCCTQ